MSRNETIPQSMNGDRLNASGIVLRHVLSAGCWCHASQFTPMIRAPCFAPEPEASPHYSSRDGAPAPTRPSFGAPGSRLSITASLQPGGRTPNNAQKSKSRRKWAFNPMIGKNSANSRKSRDDGGLCVALNPGSLGGYLSVRPPKKRGVTVMRFGIFRALGRVGGGSDRGGG